MPDSSHSSPAPLTITRHCMQHILHAALAAEEKEPQTPLFGLLHGHATAKERTLSDALLISASVLDEHEPVDTHMHQRMHTFMKQGPNALLGCFISTQSGQPSLHQLKITVGKWLQAQALPNTHIYAVLEMSHKGRMEIHCFESTEPHAEIPVSMQEDGSLYPQTSSY